MCWAGFWAKSFVAMVVMQEVALRASHVVSCALPSAPRALTSIIWLRCPSQLQSNDLVIQFRPFTRLSASSRSMNNNTLNVMLRHLGHERANQS
jgi:hypothetical protein